MNKYLRSFLHRGLIFGGFGPIVVGIVYVLLEKIHTNFFLSGTQVLIAVISTYLLAFIQAGVSVFNQIETWTLPKSLLSHFSILYASYILCYLINSWIPFKFEVMLIFTVIFAVVYLLIWITAYLTVRKISKHLNKKLFYN